MPNRLTTAGARWQEIAQRHPSLDSTVILKLCQFAAKLDSDERKIRRLVRLASRNGILPSDITIAADTPIATVEQILTTYEDDNQPPEPHNAKDIDTPTNLAKAVGACKRHQERLEWWCDRASRAGWDTTEIRLASGLLKARVEELTAAAVAERKAKAEARCDFCAKLWQEPSVYCREFDKHERLAKRAEL